MKMATSPTLRVVEREFRVFSRLWRGFVFSLILILTGRTLEE